MIGRITWGTVLKDCSIRKVENPALTGKDLWAHLVWNSMEISKMSQLISLENLLKNQKS